jgi:hypothetical protein
MIALKLFFAVITVSFILVFLSAIFVGILDFVVFVKERINEWKK